MTDAEREAQESSHRASGSPVQRVIGLLGSLKFALTVVALLAVACILGTLIPQGEQVTAFLRQHPEAARRMQFLGVLGLTHVFFSWWFAVLLCLLSASLAVCTFRRYAAFRRASGPQKGRVAGSIMTHVSLLLVLAGGVVRGFWGEKGMIEFREGETVTAYATEKGMHSLPFAVHLSKFAIEYYGAKEASPSAAAEGRGHEHDRLLVRWPARNLSATLPVELGADQVLTSPESAGTGTNAFHITVLRYEPDFTYDTATHEASSRSAQPNNPAILVGVVSGTATNSQWLFAKHPEFNMHASGSAEAALPLALTFESGTGMAAERKGMRDVKAFKSTVQILVDGRVVRAKTIEVNSPVSYGGYTLYQAGYSQEDPSWTSLQIVKDPGVGLVYAGFTLMMVGLTVVFCINPWLETQSRRKGDERDALV